ncbi:MAG: cytochrome C [Burkholderiales bacterium]|nr:cytochrome C [Burkholderiales bacterium]
MNAPSVNSNEQADSMQARGRYLVEIGGCNDCHTAGFGISEGATPESEWLLGDSLGYRGPWGTTYPPNLRMYVGNLTEEQWLAVMPVLKTRPPMPWWALNSMTAGDLQAMYRYIKSLDPIETEIPAYVPPGKEPSTPYIQWPAPPE